MLAGMSRSTLVDGTNPIDNCKQASQLTSPEGRNAERRLGLRNNWITSVQISLKGQGNKMGNMSYCRFENTASDFQDCVAALGDMTQEGFDLSKEEIRGLKSLLRGMAEAMQILGDTIGIDDVEDLAYMMADDQDKLVSQFRSACVDGDESDDDFDDK